MTESDKDKEKDKKGREEGSTRLDPKRRSKVVTRFETELMARVVGQGRAIGEIVQSFARLTSGIRNPERPVLTLLFLGPTGVGKTETIKVLANTIFGSAHAFTRVNCQEFASPHQVAKLLGAPPGYVGGDIEPILSQENIDKHHKKAFDEKLGLFRRGSSGAVEKIFPDEKDNYLSIVLFDEVEKADPVLWNTLLGILDDGHLTLGNNKEVDFTRSIIILTSNVGSFEMSKMIGGGMGFSGPAAEKKADAKEIHKAAVQAAQALFPFEFLNRFDSLVVFDTLGEEQLYQILDIYIDDLHRRVMNTETPFLLELSNNVRRFLVKQGYDLRFGARPLRRVVEKHIVTPLSNLLSTDQVKKGDFITTRLKGGSVVFEKESRTPRTLVTTRKA
ncbi:MAG: AAA family ATPase [Planctomycetota bacterium]